MGEHVEVAVIGGGQAGLAAGYHLAQQRRCFVILDQASRVGDSWRNRWDSLLLFTSAQFNSLPGLPFPKTRSQYPTKDEVADYLALYARTFELPVRLNSPVGSVKQIPDGFLMQTGSTTLQADQVIVATGPFQKPFIPPLTADVPATIFQVHTSQYRNRHSLPPGDVLVVGGGDSGVQIAEELSRSRKVYLSVGKERRLQLPQRLLGRDPFWWLYTLGIMNITIDSKLGQRLSRRDTLAGSSPAKLARKHGVVLVGRTRGVEDGRLVFDTGEQVQVQSIIWATGYRPNYRWIDVPVLDDRGAPVQRHGLTAVPGFYFLGLLWQQRRDSALLGGVGRDAAFIVSEVAARAQSGM